MKKSILALINDDKIFGQIAQEAFNSVDKDQSRTIDKAEFKECAIQVAKGFGIDDADEAGINEIYKELDSDGNGNIDFNEFKKYVKQVILKLLEQI